MAAMWTCCKCPHNQSATAPCGLSVSVVSLVCLAHIMQSSRAREGASLHSRTVLSNCRCCIILWQGHVPVLATLSASISAVHLIFILFSALNSLQRPSHSTLTQHMSCKQALCGNQQPSLDDPCMHTSPVTSHKISFEPDGLALSTCA